MEDEDGATGDDNDFESPSEVVEDYNSACKVWLTFLIFILELHDTWDDHDEEETERRAVIAQAKGREWVTAVRQHSKFTCCHYYCHVVWAHLYILIKTNGHPFCGDDAVLERGHQTYKRLRAITSGGGKVRVGGKRGIQKSTRMQRLNDGTLVARPVSQASRATREEQLGKLVRVLVKRRSIRPIAAPSAAVLATIARKTMARKEVNTESARMLASAVRV